MAMVARMLVVGLGCQVMPKLLLLEEEFLVLGVVRNEPLPVGHCPFLSYLYLKKP